jgi:hypothetical protein
MSSSISRGGVLCSAAAAFVPRDQDRDIDIFAGYDRAGMGEDVLLDPTKPFRSAVGQLGWRGEASFDLVERARRATAGDADRVVARDSARPHGIPARRHARSRTHPGSQFTP